MKVDIYCQALVQDQIHVQAPVPTDPQVEQKSPQKKEKKLFGLRADTKITWATHPTPTPTVSLA